MGESTQNQCLEPETRGWRSELGIRDTGAGVETSDKVANRGECGPKETDC